MKYEHAGKTYTLLYYGDMLDPNTGKWLKCCVYRDNSGLLFVREKQDFKENFRKVES